MYGLAILSSALLIGQGERDPRLPNTLFFMDALQWLLRPWLVPLLPRPSRKGRPL